MTKKVTKKHQLFVEHYIQLMNGTQAYLRVYPKTSYDAARVSASRLLTTDNIASLVSERLTKERMTADEAMRILEDQARGDVAELMELTSMGANIDMQTAKDRGLTKLIKRYEQKTTTIIGKKQSDDDKEIHETRIELYDAQSAAEKILKIHGKFVDRHDVTTNGESLQPVIIRIGVDTDAL
jgi:phage terminase small subunit